MELDTLINSRKAFDMPSSRFMLYQYFDVFLGKNI